MSPSTSSARGPRLVRAPNPGLMTLDGTNTWLLAGEAGVIVVDPGPAEPAHVQSITGAGAISAILLTHSHNDHSGARALLPADIPVVAADPAVAQGTTSVHEGQKIIVGEHQFVVLHTPGHTRDSVCFVTDAGDGPVVFTGDTLLGGRHASFISRHGGVLADYLESLKRLSLLTGYRGLPGHGPSIADVGVHARAALDYRMARIARLCAHIDRTGVPNAEEYIRAQYPDQPLRWAAATHMLTVELDYVENERTRIPH